LYGAGERAYAPEHRWVSSISDPENVAASKMKAFSNPRMSLKGEVQALALPGSFLGFFGFVFR
jgi:hypothetical protein